MNNLLQAVETYSEQLTNLEERLSLLVAEDEAPEWIWRECVARLGQLEAERA